MCCEHNTDQNESDNVHSDGNFSNENKKCLISLIEREMTGPQEDFFSSFVRQADVPPKKTRPYCHDSQKDTECRTATKPTKDDRKFHSLAGSSSQGQQGDNQRHFCHDGNERKPNSGYRVTPGQSKNCSGKALDKTEHNRFFSTTVGSSKVIHRKISSKTLGTTPSSGHAIHCSADLVHILQEWKCYGPGMYPVYRMRGGHSAHITPYHVPGLFVGRKVTCAA